MKFIVSSTTLLRQLQSISGVINNSNPLPILTNFLFDIDTDEMTVSTSDLETTMTTKIPVKSEGKGKVAVPAKMLIDTLKEQAEMPLSFLIDKKTFSIEISSGTGKYKLTGFDGNEFPKTPTITDASSINIAPDVLADAINKTLFATGNDDLRPAMSGVFCQIAKDNITFVATDAHKLVRYRNNKIKSSEEASFILPKKPLNILKGIVASADGDVKIEFNKTNIFFSFDNFNLTCRLIDAKYPNYEAVIPKENPNVLTVDRIAFFRAVRTASIYSNKTTHQVRLKIAGSELNISAEDYDFNNAASERLTCDYKGEDMEIGFNSRFLQEMLSNIDTEQIALEMSLPNRAGILLPVNSEEKDEDILMLVMPVMLNV